jgi:hypothetical protein
MAVVFWGSLDRRWDLVGNEDEEVALARRIVTRDVEGGPWLYTSTCKREKE